MLYTSPITGSIADTLWRLVTDLKGTTINLSPRLAVERAIY